MLQRSAILRGAPRERVQGIFHGREIEMRRNGFDRWRNQRALGVVRSLENAFFNFAIAFANVVLHFLRKSLQFLQVSLHGVCKIAELERKQVRVRQPNDCGAAGLRERAPINKVRVAEVGEPVEIVVDRMVDATLVFTAEPDVERGDTVMLQECGVIRTGTQRGNAEIGALANFLTLLRGFSIGNFPELLALPRT